MSHHFGISNIGVNLSYLQYFSDGFGSRGTFLFEAGGIFKLYPKLNVGIYVFNFTQTELKSEPVEFLPIRFKIGLSYQLSRSLLFALDFHQTIDNLNQNNLSFGIEYQLIKKVFTRIGIKTNPSKYHLGLGFYRIVPFR